MVVTHWANIDVMGDDLLPAFAKRFNAEDHRTSNGKRIQVQPVLVNSGVITEEVVSLATTNRLSGPCSQALGGCRQRVTCGKFSNLHDHFEIEGFCLQIGNRQAKTPLGILGFERVGDGGEIEQDFLIKRAHRRWTKFQVARWRFDVSPLPTVLNSFDLVAA